MYNITDMIRITDQYFWSVLFGLFFLLLVIMGSIILSTEMRLSFGDLTIIDYSLITLATWRLVRLFAYDHTTRWLREQFYDLKPQAKGYALEKPKRGVRRALADLFANPWILATWLGAMFIFFYMVSSYAYYFAAFLSVSAVVGFLQTVTQKLEGTKQNAKDDLES